MDKSLVETFQNLFTKRDIYNILMHCLSKNEKKEMMEKTRWKKNSYDTMRQYFYRGIGEKIPTTTTVELLSYKSLKEWVLLRKKAEKISKEDNNETGSNPLDRCEDDEVEIFLEELTRLVEQKALMVNNHVPPFFNNEADEFVMTYRRQQGIDTIDINETLSYWVSFGMGFIFTKGTGVLIGGELEEVTVVMYKRDQDSPVQFITDSIERKEAVEKLTDTFWSVIHGRNYIEAFLKNLK